MLSREKAVELLREHVKKENLLKHTLAVEAIMSALAKETERDENLWAMAGLLHDLDYDETYNEPGRHGMRSAEILSEEAKGGVPEEIIRAIRSHNPEYSGVKPETEMEYALMASDAVSGLIIAAALGMPSRKLADVSPRNIARRFRERDFARSCSRENMMLCEKAGLSLERFFEVSLRALQGISDNLGL
jgi:putative nucleotidyltransferase with HDIG domain